MATLLIPLVGPLQSWGGTSRFVERDTAREPSKSGVLGLLCAALGRDRAEPIDDLAALRMGVRVDSAGEVIRDYHTALDVPNADGTGRDTVVSNRHYVADAAFWAGLEGDRELLAACHKALASPVWPVFLGRKACLPSVPIWHKNGLSGLRLRDALLAAGPLSTKRPDRYRLLIEDVAGDILRPDQPIGPFSTRRFAMRRLVQEVVPCS